MAGPDELTPAERPRPRTPWSDVVLQLGQSVLTVGGALLLAHWHLVSGEIAAAAIGAGHLPAAWRLGGALVRRHGPPPAH
jgi:hypothetical protein